MRILITGGAGFVGSHLTEAWLADAVLQYPPLTEEK